MSQIALGFIPDPLTVNFDKLLPSRKLPENVTNSRKYKQIIESLRSVGLTTAGVDLGVDDPGAHRIHPHALGGHLARHPEGEGVDGRLGCSVVHILPRRTQAGGGRRQIHDGPAASTVPGAHAPQGLAGAQEGALHVDGEHALPPRQAHLVHPRGHIDHAGVVDQAAQAAHFRVDAREHGQHLGFIGHIGMHAEGLPAGGLDLLHHRLGGLCVVGVVDGHLPALLGGQQRRGGADPPAAAGHQQDFVHASPLQQ
mgnify:CR=1 FL=1